VDTNQILADFQARLEAQAQSKAQDVAAQYYEEYRNEIWLGGIALGFWILWVSTRDTCSGRCP
jgi:hypothetical protein